MQRAGRHCYFSIKKPIRNLCWTASLFTVACTLAACESNGLLGIGSGNQSSVTRSGIFDFVATPKDDQADISPQAISLAEQSQRDIASFLAQSTPSAPNAVRSTKPAQVLFNEPTVARTDLINNSIGAKEVTPGAPTKGIAASPEQTAEETAVAIPPVASVEPQPLTIDDLDAHMKGIMIEFSRELYHQSTRSDMPVRELMLLAAMTMVDPTRTISPDAMPDLTDDERSLLKNMQDHFVALGKSLDGSQDATRAVRTNIAKLQQALSQEPDLAIKTAVLCTRVRGFGDYDELDLTQLVAHRSQQAVLYIEISEFASELNEKDEWVTVTSQQLKIYSERDGIPVWQEDWRTAIDRSRQRRNDFFTVQLLSLPEPLSVGKYQLKIRLRDDKSGAETERSIPFVLLAQTGGLRSVGD